MTQGVTDPDVHRSFLFRVEDWQGPSASTTASLPLTFRITLAPLLGKAIWGWFGDLVDSVAMVTIVCGLYTSLGLGAKQIMGGMQRLNWLKSDLTEQETTDSTSWCIAIITCFATLSVISGLNYGIKTVSQTAFLLGNFLLLTVFFLDAPWYRLNVMVQSLGYHIQHFIEIGFYTDAFAQLSTSKGADQSWMDWWTIFSGAGGSPGRHLWAPSWPVSPGVAPSAMCFFTLCRCHSSVPFFGLARLAWPPSECTAGPPFCPTWASNFTRMRISTSTPPATSDLQVLASATACRSRSTTQTMLQPRVRHGH